METKEELEIVAKAAKELGLANVLPVLYQDALQPAAKVVGQQLVIVAKATGLALEPLAGVVWCYEQIRGYLASKVTAKLANKPPEEIRPPDRAIAGPILLNMMFAVDAPHLREMYANLLATAMYAPSANRVHPSFVQIIQRLTPAEANILQELGRKYKKNVVMFREHVAVLETHFVMSSDSAFVAVSSIASEWKAICISCGVAEGFLADAFYQNLLSLGILTEKIESDGLDPFPGNTDERSLLKSVSLTSYGDMFLDVCVRDM